MVNEHTCPVCGNPTLELGERIDVGFGSHNGVKCGPDHCETCGFVEQGPDPSDPPIEYFQDCWINKRNPHPVHPVMVNVKILPIYQNWIGVNVQGTGYGECREICRAMTEAFPELQRVYGYYDCPVWGVRSHFWCITSNNHVVDPTRYQFPSKGMGHYRMSRLYPSHYDDTLNQKVL